jgi:predicted DNA-binding transcriptional regulator AlpA
MNPTSIRVLTFPELKPCKGIKFTRQYIDRLERDDKFPTRVRIGPNEVGWFEHEIDRWLEDLPRGKARDRRSGPERPERDRRRAELRAAELRLQT